MRTHTLLRSPRSTGTGPYASFCHWSSVAVARLTMRSLKVKEIIATPSAVISKGARIWCADRPDALSAMTSLFWLSVDSVTIVPSNTENGRNCATISGMRSDR